MYFLSVVTKEIYKTFPVLTEREEWNMPVLFQNLESLEQLCQVLLEQTKKVLSSEQQKQQTVVGADLM
jgi:hypothetical protein